MVIIGKSNWVSDPSVPTCKGELKIKIFFSTDKQFVYCLTLPDFVHHYDSLCFDQFLKSVAKFYKVIFCFWYQLCVLLVYFTFYPFN
jgi:hypothetical protein